MQHPLLDLPPLFPARRGGVCGHRTLQQDLQASHPRVKVVLLHQELRHGEVHGGPVDFAAQLEHLHTLQGLVVATQELLQDLDHHREDRVDHAVQLGPVLLALVLVLSGEHAKGVEPRVYLRGFLAGDVGVDLIQQRGPLVRVIAVDDALDALRDLDPDQRGAVHQRQQDVLLHHLLVPGRDEPILPLLAPAPADQVLEANRRDLPDGHVHAVHHRDLVRPVVETTRRKGRKRKTGQRKRRAALGWQMIRGVERPFGALVARISYLKQV